MSLALSYSIDANDHALGAVSNSPRFLWQRFATKHAIAVLDSTLFDVEKFRVPPRQFLWRLSWPFRPAAREKCVHLFPGFLDGEPRRLLDVRDGVFRISHRTLACSTHERYRREARKAQRTRGRW
jgi:hypothetical protein